MAKRSKGSRSDGVRHGGASARQAVEARIAWGALLAAVILTPSAVGKIPFLGLPSFAYDFAVVPKAFTLALCLGVGAGAWSYGAWRGTMAVRSVPRRWWLVALGAGAVLTAALGSSPLTSFFGGQYLLAGVAAMACAAGYLVLAIQLLDSPTRLRTFSWAVIAGAMLPALVALLQAAEIDPVQISRTVDLRRGGSLLGNPNFTGTYLVVPVVLAAGLALGSRDRRETQMAWGAFGLAFAALTLTLTRGAWLGAAAGLVALGVAAARSEVGLRAGRWLAALVGAVGVLAVAVVGPSRIAERFADLSGTGALGSGRLVLWKDALRVIAEHPILGTGPDAYRYAWYGARSLESVRLTGLATVTDDPHNVVLALAATLGIPLALGALAFFGAVMLFSAGPAFGAKAPAGRLVYSAWWAALAGLAVSLLFSPATGLVMVLVALGLAVVLAPEARAVDAADTTGARAGIATYAVAAVTLALVFGLTFVSDVAMRSALTAPDQAAGFAGAQSIAPFYAKARYESAKAAATAAAVAAQTGRSDATAVVSAAEARVEALIDGDPNEYANHTLAAFLYSNVAAVGGPEALGTAIASADAALAIYPLNAEAAYLKGLSQLALGQPAEAVASLEPLWDVDPKYAQAGIVYATALIEAGRADEARDVAATLAGRFPDDPDVAALVSKVGEAPAEDSRP